MSSFINDNVSSMYNEVLLYVLGSGVLEEGRTGEVLAIQHPVILQHLDPVKCVLINRPRRANPFFHLLGDALWCLSGGLDLAHPLSYNARFSEYSDDGVSVTGAYGARWRTSFGLDQIQSIAHLLRKDPRSRRAVLTMWDPSRDIGSGSVDVPCNTQVLFRTRGGMLDATVVNRSNDLIWGMLGANVVQFSLLLQLMAYKTSLSVGKLYQISNHVHLYPRHYNLTFTEPEIYPSTSHLIPFTGVGIEQDILKFMGSKSINKNDYFTLFFREVVCPMEEAHRLYKEGNLEDAHKKCNEIGSLDWAMACKFFLEESKK